MLNSHKNIGIDIDDTLIGNGLNSQKLQKYILDNYRTKNFYLITFRTGSWLDEVWQDIAYENDLLDERFFKGLHGIPVEFRMEYQKYSWYANQNFKLIDPEVEDRINQLAPAAFNYLEWKGKKSHELGCSILVDDMTDQVRRGCTKYNVKLIHPDQLTYDYNT